MNIIILVNKIFKFCQTKSLLFCGATMNARAEIYLKTHYTQEKSTYTHLWCCKLYSTGLLIKCIYKMLNFHIHITTPQQHTHRHKTLTLTQAQKHTRRQAQNIHKKNIHIHSKQQTSEAISSIPFFCRIFSSLTRSQTAGSSWARVSLPVRELMALSTHPLRATWLGEHLVLLLYTRLWARRNKGDQ